MMSFHWLNRQVKLKTQEEEKKTIETRLQVAQKDLATIRDREAKLSNEKVILFLPNIFSSPITTPKLFLFS